MLIYGKISLTSSAYVHLGYMYVYSFYTHFIVFMVALPFQISPCTRNCLLINDRKVPPLQNNKQTVRKWKLYLKFKSDSKPQVHV